MEPEKPTAAPQSSFEPAAHLSAGGPTEDTATSSEAVAEEQRPGRMHWVFIGDQGLRAGWSVAIFTLIFGLILAFLGSLLMRGQRPAHGQEFSPFQALVSEVVSVAALLGGAIIMALIEGRKVLAYNLTGPRRSMRFLSGAVAGFAALSALVGLMAAGGWLHFGAVALSGAAILKYAALWGTTFFLVGCFEEGLFRCYLQSTLTRGLNFWWALGLVAAMCLFLATTVKGGGSWGVYAFALLGLLPCLFLQLRKGPNNGFWQAAWVTSTGFGFIHTGNNGENWVGIFAAAGIGFVFCVSVYLTGSAWWAIGCHAAWDWAETYFYGTADSGLVAKGHLLTTTPAGPTLWSGGADGPEGSLLILLVIVLLLGLLLVQYRKRNAIGAQELTAPLPN